MSEILCVVGARPNFMKMAPILRSLRPFPQIRPYLVHTGQHYDEDMSRVFFDELGLPVPDRDLDVGSDSHARQTARIMTAFEPVVEDRAPKLVIVVGDVNSTLACSLVAVKLGVPVAHVEAGLRSRDRTMPEEINRLVTDAVSDLLFATSADAVDNLRAEGVPSAKIHLVGNPMIDTLRLHLPAARERRAAERLGLKERSYALVTLHRPSNVDQPENLRRVMEALGQLAAKIPVLFPVHPRTRERMVRGGLDPPAGLRITEPLGYLDFLSLMDRARFLLTDSGGIQEETTALGVPCLTLRANTERPVTIAEGTNRLLGDDPASIMPAALPLLEGPLPPARCPSLWDGQSGGRIARVLTQYLGVR
ncbi:MAG: UDP-N-acetylglucosamine 2-epimerase (non-hydrolyzing) [Candidatus Eisenbacteria bacterium]|uniref:UDP-N-acetylglucosamine 2-epimerase (Non-hydrolyzing) n=1 Tax=Eiseniibacteriota bacterium TaxID=2212470 RepID=A0A538TBK6_UNCEI|nr:MAG: UDP-N-acetylglucosamine 2-epimerase (non-hydrolyzing) [Candidatus Eisenbacteria bacterium]